jgi:hypothetical protein
MRPAGPPITPPEGVPAGRPRAGVLPPRRTKRAAGPRRRRDAPSPAARCAPDRSYRSSARALAETRTPTRSRRAGDVPRYPSACRALERHVRAGRRRKDLRFPFEGARRARRADERRARAIAGDEMQRLGRIVRRWTRLAHEPSGVGPTGISSPALLRRQTTVNRNRHFPPCVVGGRPRGLADRRSACRPRESKPASDLFHMSCIHDGVMMIVC